MGERNRKKDLSKAVRERAQEIRATAARIRQKRIKLEKEVRAMSKRIIRTKRARAQAD